MANINSVTFKHQNGASDIVSTTKSYTYEGQNNIVDFPITIATDTEVIWTADVSQVKYLFIHSDVACTIETNATNAAGGNTLTLVANMPYIWTTDSYSSLALTSDVTKFYVTSAATGTLNIRMGFDSTP